MKAEDLHFIAELVRSGSGLSLGPGKTDLIESRLLPVARKWEMRSVDDLVQRLRAGSAALLNQSVIEAMLATESGFFRDLKLFEQFRYEALPALLAARESKKSLRIWCAACGSGQEPYSLAMILAEEQAKLAGWAVEIVATDLSAEMLAKARTGIYSQSEVQRGLPIQYLVRYFRQQNGRWIVSADIRDKVRFQLFNLMDDPVEFGSFDVIFCRNVLSYQEPALGTAILARLSAQLSEDGFLYLGRAEDNLCPGKFAALPQNPGIYHGVSA